MISRRGFFKKFIAGIAALLFGGSYGCEKKNEPHKENPYEYNIEQFKRVDPNLILYEESTPININIKLMKGITVTDDDTIIMAGDMQVYIYNSKRELLKSFNLDEVPHCVSAQTSSEIFIGMKDHVEVFDQNGNSKSSWISLGETAYITSLSVKKDLVVAADYGNKRLWIFNQEGKLLKFIDKDFVVPSPYFDVDIDNEGNIWVVNTGKLRLEEYNPKGIKKSQWGKSSMEIDGFPGCCNPTYFNIDKNGDFITAEKGIVRLKIYDKNGKMKGVVAGPDSFKEGTTGLDLASNSLGHIYVTDNSYKKIRIFVPKKKADKQQ